MIKKELVKVSVDDLVPYENNPRKIPQSAVDDVCESIKQCGQLDPIEIDENNVILAGHTRRLAYIAMGISLVDCVRYIGLTEAQKKKYRLLSNKTAEKSGWDFDLLDCELNDMDFEGYDFGFDIDDMDIFDDTDNIDSHNYDQPEKTQLICPACGHQDTAVHFKKV